MLISLFALISLTMANGNTLPVPTIVTGCEQDLAGPAFEVQQVQRQNITKLNPDVYKVVLNDGRAFVLRIEAHEFLNIPPLPKNDVRRELFAQEVLNELGVQTVRSRLLPAPVAAEILRMIREPGTKRIESAAVSYTPFSNAITGEVALNLLGVMGPLRVALLGRKNWCSTEQCWGDASEKERANVVQDLKLLIPNFKVEDLDLHREQMTPTQKKELYWMGIARLPAKLAANLATYWLAYTIMGLADAHSGNWLLGYDDEVIGIDLAYPLVADWSGRPSPIDLGRSHNVPYLRPPRTKFWDTSKMLASVRPDFMAALAKVDRSFLLAAAARANYAVTEGDLEDILGRIRYALNPLPVEKVVPREQSSLWQRMLQRFSGNRVSPGTP